LKVKAVQCSGNQTGAHHNKQMGYTREEEEEEEDVKL
jgi:hypothetical protein